MENEAPLGGSPVEAEQVLAESAPATAGTETPPADAGKPPRDRVQERIDSLTKRHHDDQAELAYWRGIAEGRQAQKQPQEDVSLVRPSREQFNGDEDAYQAALEGYYDQRADKRVQERVRSWEAEQRQQRSQQTFKEREAKFIEATPDYYEKVYDERVPISSGMVQLMADSDYGPQIAYELANDIPTASRISSLRDPVAIAREIGRIEERVANKAKPKPPAPPPVSRAPPPPPRVEQADAEVVKVDPSSPESDRLSTKEWMKRRNAQVARKQKS